MNPRGLTVEECSFINLVNHFRPELKRILKGEQAGDVIPERTTRRTLRKHGVLVGVKKRENGYMRGTVSVVTDAARRVLEDE